MKNLKSFLIKKEFFLLKKFRFINTLNSLEQYSLINVMNDYRTFAALAVPYDFVLRHTNGTPFHILAEPLVTTPVVIYFQKNSYLTQRFSDMIHRMMASGLIEHWIDNESNTMSAMMTATNNEPKKMTMENLKAPFILCAAGLALSTVIFIVELFYYRFGGKVRDLLKGV